MKNLRDFINESQVVNESKEEFTLQFCDEDGAVIDKTTIEIDTHGVNKDEFIYYNDLPQSESLKLERTIEQLLKKAHKKDRDIMLACIVQDGEGMTVAEI